MSEEGTWLLALSVTELAQVCKAVGLKVDGFRNLTLVPRLLLERQMMQVLNRQRGELWSAKLRSALERAWRERYPALQGLMKAGLTPAGDQERAEVERWGEWLVGLCRTFGRAPVEMGVQVADLPWAEPELLAALDEYWPADLPPVPPVDGPAVVVPPTAVEAPLEAPAEWRIERSQLRAELKSLRQENQTLQRARTSAEHRIAHYQSQVEQVRAEMEALANRTEWPHPKMLVQRLIRGLMEARRQILDLELANAELRLTLGVGPTPEEEAAAEMFEPELEVESEAEPAE